MGTVTAQLRNASTIEATLSGPISEIDIVSLRRQMVALLDEAPVRWVVIDTARMTTFSPKVRVPAVPFLEEIKRRGVQLVVVITPSALVRMVGATIALAAGLPHKFIADAHDADRLIAMSRAA